MSGCNVRQNPAVERSNEGMGENRKEERRKEKSDAAKVEVESPTNRGKIEESQKFRGRIPSTNLTTNSFEEAETGTKMADNLNLRKMTKLREVSKDNELEKKIRVIKKMLANWKAVLTANKVDEIVEDEEIVTIESFRRGRLRAFDEDFEKISEEVERIIEGKVDKDEGERIIDMTIWDLKAEIEWTQRHSILKVKMLNVGRRSMR